jgi:hypothetical protein
LLSVLLHGKCNAKRGSCDHSKVWDEEDIILLLLDSQWGFDIAPFSIKFSQVSCPPFQIKEKSWIGVKEDLI